MKYVYIGIALLWIPLIYSGEEYKQLLERSTHLYTNLPLPGRVAILNNEEIVKWAEQYDLNLLDQAYQLTLNLHIWDLNKGKKEPYNSLCAVLEKYMMINKAKALEFVQGFIEAYIDQIENPSWQENRDTPFEWHPHPSMFALKLLCYAEKHKQNIDDTCIVRLMEALIRDETTDIQRRDLLIKYLGTFSH